MFGPSKRCAVLSTEILRFAIDCKIAHSGRRCITLKTSLFKRDPQHVVDATEKRVILNQAELFDSVSQLRKSKDKLSYMEALKLYEQKQNVHRRGHVEFIYAAMSKMQEFSVHTDLPAYKALFDIFPKKEMVATNIWQAEFMHYPKQQDCALDILQKMENFGIVPDDAMGDLIVSIFGIKSHVMRKYQRMMYWMPKFKHMNPYPIPKQLPNDAAQLAVMALKRMAVDPENKVTLYNNTSTEKENSPTSFIASSRSKEQIELLAQHPDNTPLYVEGSYSVWLRDKSLQYFVLQTDTTGSIRPPAALHPYQEEDNWLGLLADVKPSGTSTPSEEVALQADGVSMHHQPGGTVLAMCIPSVANKDLLMAWINMLQKESPQLNKVPVIFKLRNRDSESDILLPCGTYDMVTQAKDP